MTLRVTPPELPALVEGTVSHVRRGPTEYRLQHRQYQWLVDVDDLPQKRWPLSLLARFDAKDHLDGGRLGHGVRGDVERFLDHRGVTLPPGTRVLMLAHARTLGHVFDPLTVFWCLDPGGYLLAAVLEVHNTYGERHAYLVDVDDAGRSRVDKAFYVSPFNDVGGSYAVRLVLDVDRVVVSIRLDRGGRTVLTASATGTPVPATSPALLSVAARHLLMPQRVTALIRWHGIRLWLKRLPVMPRPRHSQEAVR